MDYKKIGSLNVSRITLGTWVMGREGWPNVDDNDSFAVIAEAKDKGINIIDTAPFYGKGHAEELVGAAIQAKRSSWIVATKCGLRWEESKGVWHDLSPKRVQSELEDSLRRLKTDYIDLYQLHWPDPNTPLEATLEVIYKAIKKGQVRQVGLCNFSRADIKKAMRVLPIVSLQHPYSLLNKAVETEILGFSQVNDLAFMAYGPLHGGLLTGKYLQRPSAPKADAKSYFYEHNKESTWEQADPIIKALRQKAAHHGSSVSAEAIRWVLDQPGVTTAIVGMRSVEQLVDNLQGLFSAP
jgi:aryl-alcohol dehydrogenase-like predicted oxidoreductase